MAGLGPQTYVLGHHLACPHLRAWLAAIQSQVIGRLECQGWRLQPHGPGLVLERGAARLELPALLAELGAPALQVLAALCGLPLGPGVD